MSDLVPDPEPVSPDRFPDDPPAEPVTAPPSLATAVPPLPEKVNIGIVVLSYDGMERCEIGVWATEAVWALRHHPRVARAKHTFVTGYGAERVRNKIMADALEADFHFVLMVDNDTIPDWHQADRDQKPFFPAALDFALAHDEPVVIGAPYCAGPPNERVLVSRFVGVEGNHPDDARRGVILECFTRDESATRTGFERVSSLPTGCLLIDTRVCRVLAPPWFSYEYADERWTEFASTEDTVFTRNLFYLGVPLYVAWQSWATHVKPKHVQRPRPYPQTAVPASVRKAWEKMAKR